MADRTGSAERGSDGDLETIDVTPAARVDPAQPPIPRDEVGETLSRYVLLEEVGQGGMGRVFHAYDPRLEREVAIKVVKPERATHETAARFLLEALAMARVSHPNVVPVYDSERLPTGRLILVMEYISGPTLAAWCSQPRPWRTIVKTFWAAGQGLAAAHREGLLHRDFKPANVLISKSGVVKVTDFGLAKAIAGEPTADSGTPETLDQDLDFYSGSLTQAGVVVGTLRYMAPEQHAGTLLTAAADQFSFCVALWEALAGAAPYSGKDLGELKQDGPPAWPRADIPRRLVRALERGLAPAAEDRWPSMDALLDAIETDIAPASASRLLLATVGGVALLSGGLGVAAALNDEDPCPANPSALAGAWDDQVRANLSATVGRSKASYAPPVLERVTTHLDAYASRWQISYDDNCAATRIRNEQSAAAMDVRTMCLQHAQQVLEQTTQVLVSTGDTSSVLAKADAMVASLPELDRCDDLAILDAAVAPPRTQDIERVARARELLSQASVQRRAGNVQASLVSLARAEEALSTVEHLDSHAVLGAERGRTLEADGEYAAAEAMWVDALRMASEAGDAPLQQQLAVDLMRLAALKQNKPTEALRYHPWVQGLRSGNQRQRAATAEALALVWAETGELEKARASAEKALELYRGQAQRERSPDVAAALGTLGEIEVAAGNFDQALQHYERAKEILEEALGPEHPRVVGVYSRIGYLLFSNQRWEPAADALRKARELSERVHGADHPVTLETRINEAAALDITGDHDGAVDILRSVLERMEARGTEASADTAQVRFNLALSLNTLGQRDEALAMMRASIVEFERSYGPNHRLTGTSRSRYAELLPAQAAESEFRKAIASLEASLGAKNPEVALTRGLLAGSLEQQQRFDAAATEYARAIEQLIAAFGTNDPRVASVRVRLARVLLRLERPARALELAEFAWLQLEGKDTVNEAECAFALARALVATDGSPDRAIQLAGKARDMYAEGGESYAEPLAEVNAWIDASSLRSR